MTINPPTAEPDETVDYKGKLQTGKPTFTADPDTKAPGGGDNKIEKITLVDADGKEVDEVKVPGEGTYKLKGGTITFTPEPDFVGKTSGVKVRGYDSNNQSADTTYTPTVKHKVKYVDPLNPEDEQVVQGPEDSNKNDGSDITTTYEDDPGTDSKNHPGYRFDGWDEEEVDDPDHPGDKIIVRTAIYTPMYNINYDPNGGTGEMKDDNYDMDESTMPHKSNTFTREGYTFTGFKAYITNPETGVETAIVDASGNPIIFQDANDMAKYFKNMPGGTSIRMEAQWEKLPHATWIDPATGRIIQVQTDFLDANTEPPAPKDPTRDGYVFDGWDRYVDDEGNVTYLARRKPISVEEKIVAEKTTSTPSGLKSVATGDDTTLLYEVIVISASIAAFALMIVARRRRKME